MFFCRITVAVNINTFSLIIGLFIVKEKCLPGLATNKKIQIKKNSETYGLVPRYTFCEFIIRISNKNYVPSCGGNLRSCSFNLASAVPLALFFLKHHRLDPMHTQIKMKIYLSTRTTQTPYETCNQDYCYLF